LSLSPTFQGWWLHLSLHIFLQHHGGELIELITASGDDCCRKGGISGGQR
jgi:hypothetical protein